MLNTRRAALAAAFFLSACGGGGGGDGDATPAPPAPPAAIAPADALRLTAQAVMDVTELAWALASDVQLQVSTAPTTTIANTNCTGGGTLRVSRPSASLLRIDSLNCSNGGVTFNGLTEVESAVVTVASDGVDWSGSVRWTDYSVTTTSFSSRTSGTAVGTGFIESAFSSSGRGQPMTMQLSALTATRTPDALGRAATLTSPLFSVGRIPSPVGPTRDLYALLGCVTITAAGVNAELCIEGGSQIALIENVGTEQLTGRLRWNAGTPGGFDARLRATPGGAPGTSTLRIELDLDGNGSFETSATLDRTTDIGLRI
jgi:hypothetical protein